MLFNKAGPMSRRRYRQVDFLYLVEAVASSRTISCSVARDKSQTVRLASRIGLQCLRTWPLCDSELRIISPPKFEHHPSPVSTGILPHSLPEWAFRARPGLWRNCLCPKVARVAEQKFGSR